MYNINVIDKKITINYKNILILWGDVSYVQAFT